MSAHALWHAFPLCQVANLPSPPEPLAIPFAFYLHSTIIIHPLLSRNTYDVITICVQCVGRDECRLARSFNCDPFSLVDTSEASWRQKIERTWPAWTLFQVCFKYVQTTVSKWSSNQFNFLLDLNMKQWTTYYVTSGLVERIRWYCCQWRAVVSFLSGEISTLLIRKWRKTEACWRNEAGCHRQPARCTYVLCPHLCEQVGQQNGIKSPANVAYAVRQFPRHSRATSKFCSLSGCALFSSS